jgi:hypothetical protein
MLPPSSSRFDANATSPSKSACAVSLGFDRTCSGNAERLQVLFGISAASAHGYGTAVKPSATAADLLIERTNKFETILDLKTAKAIGVEVPTSPLVRADELIE